MATPRSKYVNCLVSPRAKPAKPCYFLLNVSLASLKIEGKDPDIGASLAQKVARQSHNPALPVNVRCLKVVKSTLTRDICFFQFAKSIKYPLNQSKRKGSLTIIEINFQTKSLFRSTPSIEFK